MLVITCLVIHKCRRHHCHCYTSEIRPTPHFAASICSYCYVNGLSDVAYMLLPFTDSREVKYGSWTLRLLCRLALHSLTQILHHKISFCFCWGSAFINTWNTEMIWQSHTCRHTHLAHVCVCVCVYCMRVAIRLHNTISRETIMHYLAILLLCELENTGSWGSEKGKVSQWI